MEAGRRIKGDSGRKIVALGGGIIGDTRGDISQEVPVQGEWECWVALGLVKSKGGCSSLLDFVFLFCLFLFVFFSALELLQLSSFVWLPEIWKPVGWAVWWGQELDRWAGGWF